MALAQRYNQKHFEEQTENFTTDIEEENDPVIKIKSTDKKFSTWRNFTRGMIVLTPTLSQSIFKQKKMSLGAENSAQWKMALTRTVV